MQIYDWLLSAFRSLIVSWVYINQMHRAMLHWLVLKPC